MANAWEWVYRRCFCLLRSVQGCGFASKASARGGVACCSCRFLLHRIILIVPSREEMTAGEGTEDVAVLRDGTVYSQGTCIRATVPHKNIRR